MWQAIAGAAANAGGQALGNWFSARTNFKYNRRLNQQVNQQNIAQWNRENEYNTPENQMKRFADAGLNPNLIYGQGNAGNAGSSPQMDSTSMNMQPIDMGQVFGTYTQLRTLDQNIKQSDAAIAKMNADTALTTTQQITEGLKQLYIASGTNKNDADTRAKNWRNQFNIDTEKYQKQAIEGNVHLMNQQLKNLGLDFGIKSETLKTMPWQRESIKNDVNLKKLTASEKRQSLEGGRIKLSNMGIGATESGDMLNTLMRFFSQAYDNNNNSNKNGTSW